SGHPLRRCPSHGHAQRHFRWESPCTAHGTPWPPCGIPVRFYRWGQRHPTVFGTPVAVWGSLFFSVSHPPRPVLPSIGRPVGGNPPVPTLQDFRGAIPR